MNVQNPSLTTQAVDRAESAIKPGYMSGFGNGFETEALPGALPIGRNCPSNAPTVFTPSSFRLAVHRAAHHQRALLALPHPPDCDPLGPVPEGRYRPLAHSACRRSRSAAAPMRWDPIRCRRRRSRFWKASTPSPRRAMPDAGRHGLACLSRDPFDGGRVLLQCRRRTAVPQQGPTFVDRVPHHRHRAGRDCRHSPRGEDPCRAQGWAGARLSLRELRRCLHLAGARTDRGQLPRQSA